MDMKTYTSTKPVILMDLGDLVQDRKGRVGKLTQVNREIVYVRFVEGEKAKMLYRVDVTPLKYLAAMAEVEEDDRNAAAYRAAR